MAKSKPSPAPGRLARVLAAARTACAEHVLDAVALAACAAVVHGVALIYPPAAWIVGGLMALAGVVLYVRLGPSVEDVVNGLAPEAGDEG